MGKIEIARLEQFSFSHCVLYGRHVCLGKDLESMSYLYSVARDGI